MLDGDDSATRASVRELQDVAARSSKPLVIWAGAGTSAWAGLPTWPQLAQAATKQFVRVEPTINVALINKLTAAQDLPALFGHLREVNDQRLNAFIVDALASPAPSPVFQRFSSLLTELKPLKVVSTNFDESLRLPTDVRILQRSDIEGAIQSLQGDVEFLLKLHGTLGSISTCVITTRDYEALVRDPSYISFVEQLFLQSHVLFIGTSLSDDYVVGLLHKTLNLNQLFGNGPHFFVGTPKVSLPKSVKQLRISQTPFSDYRSSLHALELVKETRAAKHVPPSENGVESHIAPDTSAYFISDFIPLGTVQTSQTLTVTSQDGATEAQLIVGMGFTDEEAPGLRYTALQDLIVGLICFDLVVTPVGSIGRLHELLGSDRFWMLVDADAIRFLWFPHDHVVLFPEIPAPSGGGLGQIRHMTDLEQELTLRDELKRQLHAGPGHEHLYERLISRLEECSHIVPEAAMTAARTVVSGAILSERLRRLLGFSDGFRLSNIPRWNVYGVLRLTHVALTGVICHRLNLNAAKLQFGTDVLASSTFGLVTEKETAAEVASYVVTGTFHGNIQAIFERDPSLLKFLLLYRESPEALMLRQEIKAMLATNSGTEFIAALNAGLRRFVSSMTVEHARRRFCLMAPETISPHQAKSVVHLWQDESRGTAWMTAWRARSRKILADVIAEQKLSKDSSCPCGSGEPIKDCCGFALRI